MRFISLLPLVLLTAACESGEPGVNCPLKADATFSGEFAMGRAYSSPPYAQMSGSITVDGVDVMVGFAMTMPDPNAMNGGIMPGTQPFAVIDDLDESCEGVCASFGVIPLDRQPGVPFSYIAMVPSSGSLVLEEVDLTPGTGRLKGSFQNVEARALDGGDRNCFVNVESLTFDLPIDPDPTM